MKSFFNAIKKKIKIKIKIKIKKLTFFIKNNLIIIIKLINKEQKINK